MAKSPSKCPVCKSTKYKINTINGHSCCEFCDGEFCFGCGSSPVELLGNAGVCAACMKKRTALQAFEPFSYMQVLSDEDVPRAIATLREHEASGVLTEDEQSVVYELELSGHYAKRN